MMIVNLHTHFRLPAGQTGLMNHSALAEFRPEPGLFYSAGIHPWDAEKVSEEQPAAVRELVRHPQVLAVGECGLDRSVDIPLEVQLHVFGEQVEIAEAGQMPVIIHAVRSYSDLLHLKKQRRSGIPWILHGYSGHPDITVQLARMGFYFSFGPALLGDREKINQALPAVPRDRLFLETDDRETSLEDLYHFASGLLGVAVGTLEKQVWANFQQVFGQHC